jgi:hypothetical protein
MTRTAIVQIVHVENVAFLATLAVAPCDRSFRRDRWPTPVLGCNQQGIKLVGT